MNHCIVLGFGRSGTSLMGGILFHSGYYLGDDLFPPRESNPLGFFETDMINGINEKILELYDYDVNLEKSFDLEKEQTPFHPKYGQRWLSFIEPSVKIQSNNSWVLSEIQRVVSVPAFAYKDPRFSYTLPVWLPFLPANTIFICMFRHPEHTVESVVKDCKTADYLEKFRISPEEIRLLWQNCYRNIIYNLVPVLGERLVFVHYEQLLSGEMIPVLSQKLKTPLNGQFIVPELNRSKNNTPVDGEIELIYRKLCSLAGM